jgi:hypothetical protein
MDQDPKTAEIVSKILMLTENKKIKNPYFFKSNEVKKGALPTFFVGGTFSVSSYKRNGNHKN